MTDRELLECLKDRPCEACKFHSDKGCSKWDCVFDSKKALEQEPCGDAISRQAVLEGLANIAKAKAKSDAQKSMMGRAMFFVEQLPYVNPQEPKTGHWIKIRDCYGNHHFTCSECGNDIATQYADNWEDKYCPNCGAKMEDKS